VKNFITIVLIFSLWACNNDESSLAIIPGEATLVDTLPGRCPYLTNDAEGNIVISWVRTNIDSGSVFCYAVSADKGHSFGKTIVIPSSDNIQPHSENLPKIVFKPSGEIIALWGAANPVADNKYSGLVFYSQSFDGGLSWAERKKLVEDTAGYDQRYYDVALMPNGEAAIIWLDNRKTINQEGSSLYFATTTGRAGFDKGKMISQGCCQCCRTDLFVDHHANIHVLYRGIIKDSIRDMVHSVSVDGGKSFSFPRLISNDNWVIRGCPHTGPAMTENKDGLHFTWFTGGVNKGCFYTRSADNGNNFSHWELISPAGSHPQVMSFPNGTLVVAWDESVSVDNKYYKRIGLQARTSGGEKSQAFVTDDTLSASYPVIVTAGEQRCVLTYTIKKEGRDYIMYRLVDIDI
jgi:hypothetical protein